MQILLGRSKNPATPVSIPNPFLQFNCESLEGESMASPIAFTIQKAKPSKWQSLVRKLGPRFAERAGHHDSLDRFVADNYADLRAAGLFAAPIPQELGGGGASYPELCEIIRNLAHFCGSTALAYSMHSYLVATTTWRWKYLKAPSGAFLRHVAENRLILVSSGGSDWLQSSGTAEAVSGGFRVNACKAFASGSPAGDLLLTSAVYQDPEDGPTVLHFPIDLKSPEVKMLAPWRALGMRGTGSNDISIEGVFVPESAVTVRRPQGKWHPFMHVVSLVAFPLIYAAYAGIAEAARELALREAAGRRDSRDVQQLVGEMENELMGVHLAHRRMIELAETCQPGMDATNQTFIARTLLSRAAIQTVEKAMEVVGGGSFYRSLGLERLFRDVQAARFHPLQENAQRLYAGRLALSLDPDMA